MPLCLLMEINTYDIAQKDAERDNIENLIMGGVKLENVILKYPHHNETEITKRIEHISSFCWLGEDERGDI